MEGPSTAVGRRGGDLVARPIGAPSARAVARFAGRDRSPYFWAALWLAAAAAEFGALVPVLFDTGEPVDGVGLLFRLTGGSFVVCGLIAWRRRRDSRAGMLMTLTGFALFLVPVLSQIHVEAASTVSFLLADLWSIIFVALLLTITTGGRVRSTVDWLLIAAFVLPLLVLQVAYLLVWEQEGNALSAFPDADVAKWIDHSQRTLLALACAATAAAIAVRWRDASRPQRRALLPSVAGIVCLSLFTGMLVNDLISGSRPAWLQWTVLGSIVLVPAAFLWGLLRSRLARGDLADLFLGLGGLGGGDLQTALARAIGDPALEVAYRLPGSRGYARSDGSPIVLPPAGGSRSVAKVSRDGRQLAALVYDSSLEDDPELLEAACAATAIALENEHLHAESQARLTELKESRERIVAAGDAERRRLERDLHDGAQQRLVAIALQLRLVQGRIREDPSLAEQLVESASGEIAESLSELRELAHGLHPAVLEHGLAPALETLASRSPVPATVSVELSRALPKAVELALYFVACEALANVGKYARATVVTIRAHSTGDTAGIEIADDGIGGADDARGSGLRGLADRVEALDGRLRVSSPPGAGTVVSAELPCGS